MASATHDDWQSGKSVAESTCFMFDQELVTDVTFNFPSTDKIIKAHRFMLMARSHVFFTMFNSGLDKPGEATEIPDIELDIFKQFLRYLYLGDTKLTTTQALQLTYCAEKYQVTALKALCTRFLLQRVNKTTWAEILDHAVFYNEETLTQACLQVLESCKSLETQGLEEYHISRQTLELILDYEELSVTEVDILKFCQTWAEQECKNNEVPVNMTNKRKMLGPLLTKIPFCSMKEEEFVAEVSGRHFLNGQEEFQVLRYICGADKANPPFPCMKPREADNAQVSVKLPDLWDSSRSGSFYFLIRCSQSYTLIGLTFTNPGEFHIVLGSVCKHLDVQPGRLTVYLKEAVHCKAGAQLKVCSVGLANTYPVRAADYPFTTEVKAYVSGVYKKLDFVIKKDAKSFNKPPFDTLIVRPQ